MDLDFPYMSLPIMLAGIRQADATGELVLEQNDGTRRFRFDEGILTSLRSEAAGEQFGSYLLRTGILDLASLNDLLADSGSGHLGEKVVAWGMMRGEERDALLTSLQEQVLLHALEHRVIRWAWEEPTGQASSDGRIRLESRQLIWRAFQESTCLDGFLEILRKETAWTWEGCKDLMERLGGLPLTPATAYAATFFMVEPVGFEAFCFLGRLEEAEAARLLSALWAMGDLVRVPGKQVEAVRKSATLPVPSPACQPAPAPRLPLIMPPADAPFGPPKTSPRPPLGELEPLEGDLQPEFLDFDEGSSRPQELAPEWHEDDVPPHPRPDDLPPCGPRPEPRLHPRADDLPPCGPRPEPRIQLRLEEPPGEPAVERAALPMAEAPLPPPVPVLSEPIALDSAREGMSIPRQLTESSQARTMLGRVRRQVMLGRSLEAIQTLEQLVQLPAGDEVAYEAWLTLGKLRMANPAWFARALQALKTAAQLRSQAAEPWLAMGEIQHRIGDDSEAAACFRQARERDASAPLPPYVHIDEPRPPVALPERKPGLLGAFRSRGRD